MRCSVWVHCATIESVFPLLSPKCRPPSARSALRSVDRGAESAFWECFASLCGTLRWNIGGSSVPRPRDRTLPQKFAASQSKANVFSKGLRSLSGSLWLRRFRLRTARRRKSRNGVWNKEWGQCLDGGCRAWTFSTVRVSFPSLSQKHRGTHRDIFWDRKQFSNFSIYSPI